METNRESVEPGAATMAEAEGEDEHRSEIALALRAVAKDKLAVVGTLILLAAILVAVAAPLISPYGPNEVADNAVRLSPPLTPGFILGTDGQGRDILSRIIWGGRVSIPIAAAPIAVSSVLGLILGLTAGFAGGLLGGFIMRSLDVLFAFPGVLLAVAVATIMGSGMMNVTLAMSIVLLPWVARIVYVETVSTLQMEFVDAAKACNAGPIPDTVSRTPAQRHQPGHRLRHHLARRDDRLRRGLELPRRGRPAANGGLGDHGLRRPQRRRVGALDFGHSRRGNRHRGGRLQLRGRWAARCARPPPTDAPLGIDRG